MQQARFVRALHRKTPGSDVSITPGLLQYPLQRVESISRLMDVFFEYAARVEASATILNDIGESSRCEMFGDLGFADRGGRRLRVVSVIRAASTIRRTLKQYREWPGPAREIHVGRQLFTITGRHVLREAAAAINGFRCHGTPTV